MWKPEAAVLAVMAAQGCKPAFTDEPSPFLRQEEAIQGREIGKFHDSQMQNRIL